MGSIRRRSGKYQAQIRRKGVKPISKTFVFHEDAKKWLRETEGKIDRGEYGSLLPDEITLAQVLQRYLREVTCHKKGAPQETRRIRRLLTQKISRLAVSELTGSELAAFRDSSVQDGKRACQYDLVIIRHALEVARKEWGLSLPINPVSQIKIPNGIRRRERRLEKSELEALQKALSESRNAYLWSAIELAIETGMRRSELLRLTWGDVCLSQRLAYLKDTKNGHARTIPLTSKAIQVLSKLPQGTPRVLMTTEYALRQAWERLVKRAGIDNLRFHDLRHEAVSRFFEMGLSVPEVALISGHKDISMLMRYTHVRPSNILRKFNRNEQILATTASHIHSENIPGSTTSQAD